MKPDDSINKIKKQILVKLVKLMGVLLNDYAFK